LAGKRFETFWAIGALTGVYVPIIYWKALLAQLLSVAMRKYPLVAN